MTGIQKAIAGAVLALLIIAGGLTAYVAQSVPQAGAAALNAWADVESQFRLRAELTPQLINVVRSINDTQAPLIQELSDKQADVLALKSDADIPLSQAKLLAFWAHQDGLSQALGKIYDFLKYYPDRVRDPDIRAGLEALEQSELRIVQARKAYSTRAAALNSLLTKAPQSWIAARLSPPLRPVLGDIDTIRNN